MAFGTTTSAYEMDGVGAKSTDTVANLINSGANRISQLQGVAQSNNAFEAEQARLQREWSAEQSAKAMEFNAAEAAKNRDWQEMMSNTAHQREIKDLMAAGLNPVLSAMNGNGAAVTSGATASGVVGSGSKANADTSASGAIANLLGSILAAQTQIQASNISARTQEAVADKYTAMSEIVAQINAAAGIQQAGIHSGATRYAADQSYAASKYAADRSKYGVVGNVASSIGDVLQSGSVFNQSAKSLGEALSGKRSFADAITSDPGWDSSLLGKLVNKISGKK